MAMSAKTRRDRLAQKLNQEAQFAYTAGASRQVLYIAAWLLRDFRTDQELAPMLALVEDSLLPQSKKILRKRVRELAKR